MVYKYGYSRGKLTMFLYVMLLIVGLIVAVIIPLLYHFITGAGLSMYETMLHLPDRVTKARQKSDPGQSSYEDLPIPMGMISRDTRALLACVDNKPSKVELQFRGDNSYDGPRKVYSAPSRVEAGTQARPLIREDRRTDVGKAYKVTRRTAR